MSNKKSEKFIVYIAGECSTSYKEWIVSALDGRNVKIKCIKNDEELGKVSEYPNLVVFTGGADVGPHLYNQRIGSYTQIDPKRDKFESSFFSLFNVGRYSTIPKLGICRGAQYLTIKSGGELIQHVEGHGRDHEIVDQRTKKRYMMTSDHHQMMNPYVQGCEFKLIAHSRKFESHIYLNGENQNIELANDFLESEIVFYPTTRSLCIQGHPEYSTCDSKTSDYCKQLLNDLIDKKL